MKIFKTFKFIFATVLLMIGTGARAYDFTVDGMYYKVVSLSDLTCEVTDFGQYSGNIVIPSKVMYNNRTLTVIGIGNYAFNGCSGLTSITIPNSVTRIGDYAFRGCSGLTSITIPNSITRIGDYAFRGCSGLTSITIPNSMTRIGDNVFYCCTSLTSVTIPNSVTSIGSQAFYDCTGLTSVTIPNSVTSISTDAFRNCFGLETLIIEDGIEPFSMYYSSGASDVSIFEDCPLKTLYLGRNITYSSKRPSYYKTVTEVTIGNSVTRICNRMFSGCSRLASITIPNSVTSIGSSSFYGCSRLTALYSLNPIPPAIEDGDFTNGEDNFTNKQYMNLNVYVPQGSLSAYQNADVWKNFWNLQEFDPTTGVETIKADGKKADDDIYDIQGRKLNAPKKGLNIINGKKVLIKE